MSKQFGPDRLTAAANAAASFGDAASAVDEATAAAFATNRTDLRMIGILNRDGARTAGQLAAESGLSPAATTTSIQRLVAAGHVIREVDGDDRRRVVVSLAPPAQRLLVSIYGPVGASGTELLARYSDEQLDLLIDFLERGQALQQQQALRIRALKSRRKDPSSRAE